MKISTQELVTYRKLGKHTSTACLSLSLSLQQTIDQSRARRTDVNTYVLARGLYTYKTRAVRGGGGVSKQRNPLYFNFTPTQGFISFIQFMLLFLHDSTLDLTILSKRYSVVQNIM